MDREKKKKKSLLNQFLSLILPLILGAVIVYFLLKDIDLDEMWKIMGEANWAILFISLPFSTLGHMIRGYRWKLLIKPLGYNPSLARLNLSVLGGYAINYAIPRAGEVWRCGIVAKDEKVPFTKLFGTMLIDRVFDTATVICISLFAVAMNMNFFITQLSHNEETIHVLLSALKSPTPYIIIGLIILIIFIVLRLFSQHKIVMKLKEVLKDIGNDTKAIWKMKEKNRLFLCAIGIWTCYFFFFYITFYAFDFTKDLGFTAGLIAFALSSISMAIPTNGGLGPWQVAVIASLTLYGVSQLSATAFATGVFMMQSAWQITVGLICIAILAFMKQRTTAPLAEPETKE